MKRFAILFLSWMLCSSVFAQTENNQDTASKPQASLVLKEESFDFGKIPQGKPVIHNFEVVNNGNVPFKLDNVQAIMISNYYDNLVFILKRENLKLTLEKAMEYFLSIEEYEQCDKIQNCLYLLKN